MTRARRLSATVTTCVACLPLLACQHTIGGWNHTIPRGAPSTCLKQAGALATDIGMSSLLVAISLSSEGMMERTATQGLLAAYLGVAVWSTLGYRGPMACIDAVRYGSTVKSWERRRPPGSTFGECRSEGNSEDAQITSVVDSLDSRRGAASSFCDADLVCVDVRAVVAVDLRGSDTLDARWGRGICVPTYAAEGVTVPRLRPTVAADSE
jgi:hypothetical protein